MVYSESITTEKMHHPEPNFSLERSLGHAILGGAMTAEEAMECIDAYERTFNPGEIGAVIAFPTVTELPPAA